METVEKTAACAESGVYGSVQSTNGWDALGRHEQEIETVIRNGVLNMFEF